MWLVILLALCLSVPVVNAQETVEPERLDVDPIGMAAAMTQEALEIENLEFVSGEVTSLNEAARTLTVKLYGETQPDKNDRMITVKVDDATDITDGEVDRELVTLVSGSEVDIEYDPINNKATYIFVY